MTKIYFTEDHEWIAVDGENATIGITEHAQEQLGDLVFVELPETGRNLSKGEEAVVVESVKAASDVYAPVSGEITEVNAQLGEDPALVNRSAQKDGWLFKLKLADASELDDLMSADAYQNLIG